MGSGPAGPWGLGVPVISVSALGPLASCPGCRDVPSVAWRLLDCGEGCPPAPCVGLGSGASSLGRVSVVKWRARKIESGRSKKLIYNQGRRICLCRMDEKCPTIEICCLCLVIPSKIL